MNTLPLVVYLLLLAAGFLYWLLPILIWLRLREVDLRTRRIEEYLERGLQHGWRNVP